MPGQPLGEGRSRSSSRVIRYTLKSREASLDANAKTTQDVAGTEKITRAFSDSMAVLTKARTAAKEGLEEGCTTYYFYTMVREKARSAPYVAAGAAFTYGGNLVWEGLQTMLESLKTTGQQDSQLPADAHKNNQPADTAMGPYPSAPDATEAQGDQCRSVSAPGVIA
jgi:hypothetical protein